MPYIDKQSRVALEHQLQPLGEMIKGPGELNYVLTRLVMEFITTNGLNYNIIALVTGVLQNVSTELYRRVFVRYEERKIAENGDIESLRQER